MKRFYLLHYVPGALSASPAAWPRAILFTPLQGVFFRSPGNNKQTDNVPACGRFTSLWLAGNVKLPITNYPATKNSFKLLVSSLTFQNLIFSLSHLLIFPHSHLLTSSLHIDYLCKMILVTGGTGFLGGHLLMELIKTGVPVRALISEKRHPEKVLSVWKHYMKDGHSLMEKVEWFGADVSDKVSLSPAFEGVEKVYHCAAIVSFNPGMRRKMYEVNVTGTKHVVDLCLERKVKKLVHVSSISAIRSTINGEPATENDGWPIKSSSWYSKTKTMAEMEVWRGIVEGLDAVLVNPSVILGPGRWNTGSPRFFGVSYKGLKFYTHGITGYVDVRDVTAIMMKLMNSDITGERFILNAANLSFGEIFRKITHALGVKVPSIYATRFLTAIGWRAEFLKYLITGIPPVITKQSARTAHIQQSYSSKKIEKTLNYSFKPIDDTIREVAGMFLKEVC